MFGWKKIKPAPLRFAGDPRPAHAGPSGAQEQAADAAVALISQALGIDLDFGPAFIFAPSHWGIPEVGDTLRAAGFLPEMMGNRLQLLKSPVSVAKVSAMAPDHPIRTMLEKARIGANLYDPEAENGYADGLAQMQAQALTGLMAEYRDDAEARRYAVIALHKWSCEVMLGKAKL